MIFCGPRALVTYESNEGVSIFKSKDDLKAAWVIRAGLHSHALLTPCPIEDGMTIPNIRSSDPGSCRMILLIACRIWFTLTYYAYLAQEKGVTK